MLQMHNKIAVFQIREINVECGARSLRVRRFLAARTLDFVASEDFRIGDDHELRFVTNEAAGERTDLDVGFGVGFVSRLVGPQSRRYTELFPDFLKALALAIVVAKDVDVVLLPEPAVKLLEKFTALRLGNLRFGRAFRQRTEGIK